MTQTLHDIIETEKFKVFMLEPGIIENNVKSGVTIEVKDAWELKKNNSHVSEGNNYAVLVISGHLSSITKEAREVISSREFAGKTIAKALLIDSLGHRIVGNFYLTVNRPFIKTKIFTDRDEAIAWLRSVLRA